MTTKKELPIVIIDGTVLKEVDFKYYLKQITFSEKIHVILFEGSLDFLDKNIDRFDFPYQKENFKKTTEFIHDISSDFEKISNGGISLDEYVETHGSLLSIWKQKDNIGDIKKFIQFVVNNSSKKNVRIISKNGHFLYKLKQKGYCTEQLKLEKIHLGYKDISNEEFSSLSKGSTVKGLYVNDFAIYGTKVLYLNAINQASNISFKKKGLPFEPADLNQKMYNFHLFNERTSVVLCTGKAGSGKTLLAIQSAIVQIHEKKYKKLIIARPAIATEDNGSVPGNAKEKVLRFMRPLRKSLVKLSLMKWEHDRIAKNMLNSLDAAQGEEADDALLEVLPLDSMDGETFDDSIIIVDEGQNLKRIQAKRLVTRIGKSVKSDSKLIICGDILQISSEKVGPYTNGLAVSLRVLKKSSLSGIIQLSKCYRSDTAALGDLF